MNSWLLLSLCIWSLGWTHDTEPVHIAFSDAQPYHLELDLKEDTFLHFTVHQYGLDVQPRLIAPNGKVLTDGNRDIGSFGQESIFWITSLAGLYVLEVKPMDKNGGACTLTVMANRPVQPQDRLSLLGYSQFKDGEQSLNNSPQDLTQARENFVGAVEYWKQSNQTSDQCLALSRLGEVLTLQGERKKALSIFGQMEEIFNEQKHGAILAEALFQTGRILSAQGLPTQANMAWSRAADLAEHSGNLNLQALCLNEQGTLGQHQGWYSKAISFYLQSYHLYSELGMKRESGVLQANIGKAYSLVNQKTRAKDAFLYALDLYLEAGAFQEAARIQVELGWLEYMDESYNRAESHYKQALHFFEKDGSSERIAGVLDRLGSLHDAQGRNALAREEFNQSMYLTSCSPLEKKNGDINLAHTNMNLAQLELHEGNDNQALDRAQTAHKLFTRWEVQEFAAYALRFMARVHRVKGRMAIAESLAEQALITIEKLRVSNSGRTTTRSFSASRFDYYTFYIDLLMQRHRIEPDSGYDLEALTILERGRTWQLTAALQNPDVLSPSDKNKETQIWQRIIEAERMRIRSHKDQNEQTSEEAERNLRTMLGEHDLFLGSIENLGNATKPRPLTLLEIQETLLDNATSALVFSLQEPQSYAWLVSKDSVYSFHLPSRSVIENKAREFLALLAASRGRSYWAKTAWVSAAMGKMLLGEIEPYLNTPRLAIIGDGLLHQVPFAAIIKPDKEVNTRFQGTFGAEYQIVQIPSLGMLRLIRERDQARNPGTCGVAVFADPVYQTNDPRLDVKPLPNLDPAPYGFMRLPFAGKEVDMVTRFFSDQHNYTASGVEANRAQILKMDLRDYRVLHFAVHGVADPVYPELSGLAFSNFTNDGKERESLLRGYEIGNLDLTAELVVVGSCFSAKGRLYEGEGPINLARNFFRAGASRLLVHLWQADDQSTYLLMEAFYRFLFEEDLEPAEALRRAQNHLRQKPATRAPYYWAGWVLQGDWNYPGH